MTPISRIYAWTSRRLAAFLALAFVAGFCFGSLAPNGLRVLWQMPVAVPAVAFKLGNGLCKDWGELLDLVPLGKMRFHFICHHHAVFRDIPILPRIDEPTKRDGK